LCDPCWDNFLAHRNKPGRGHQQPHEKTDELMVQRMNDILYAPDNVDELSQLHEDDEQSTWFGELPCP
jgi:hypothetical protein